MHRTLKVFALTYMAFVLHFVPVAHAQAQSHAQASEWRSCRSIDGDILIQGVDRDDLTAASGTQLAGKIGYTWIRETVEFCIRTQSRDQFDYRREWISYEIYSILRPGERHSRHIDFICRVGHEARLGDNSCVTGTTGSRTKLYLNVR